MVAVVYRHRLAVLPRLRSERLPGTVVTALLTVLRIRVVVVVVPAAQMVSVAMRPARLEEPQMAVQFQQIHQELNLTLRMDAVLELAAPLESDQMAQTMVAAALAEILQVKMVGPVETD